MSTQRRAAQTALPPPMRQLLHRERPIGWLEGSTLGFFGFADARDAANAAWVAYRTVSRKVAPLLGTRPTPIDIEPLTIERRNGRDAIAASGRPVAWLVRPGRNSLSGPDWFGFAIEIPPAVSERALPAIMRAASHAVLKSGLPWSMVRSRSRHRGDELPWNSSAPGVQLPIRTPGRRFLTRRDGEDRRRRGANHLGGDASQEKTSDETQTASSHRDQHVANLLGETEQLRAGVTLPDHGLNMNARRHVEAIDHELQLGSGMLLVRAEAARNQVKQMVTRRDIHQVNRRRLADETRSQLGSADASLAEIHPDDRVPRAVRKVVGHGKNGMRGDSNDRECGLVAQQSIDDPMPAESTDDERRMLSRGDGCRRQSRVARRDVDFDVWVFAERAPQLTSHRLQLLIAKDIECLGRDAQVQLRDETVEHRGGAEDAPSLRAAEQGAGAKRAVRLLSAVRRHNDR